MDSAGGGVILEGMVRRRIAIAVSLILGSSAVARANGRKPASVSVRIAPGDPDRLLAAHTFGLLVSDDAGASFRWVCEGAIGYGGTYDPDYAIAAGGRIYATTFQGLRFSDDGGCTWQDVGPPLQNPTFVEEVEIGPDGRVWAGTTTNSLPNDVYVSTDGATFTSAGLTSPDTLWHRLRIAPSDGNRIYVSGLQIPASGPELARLEVSTDGGANFDPLPVDDFAFGPGPDLFLEAVHPTDPDIVFARVRGARSPVGDDIYRSDDGGQNWSLVLSMAGTITAFTLRADGQTIIAGTVTPCEGEELDADKGCVRISTDGGQTFDTPGEEPKMACVAERADGTLLACGDNAGAEAFAIGRSPDAMSWTALARFTDVAGPLDCPAGTLQNDCAIGIAWLEVCGAIGLCSTADPDAGPGDDAGVDPPGDGGCCSVSGPGRGLLGVLAVYAAAVIGLGRRRRPSRSGGL